MRILLQKRQKLNLRVEQGSEQSAHRNYLGTGPSEMDVWIHTTHDSEINAAVFFNGWFSRSSPAELQTPANQM